MAESRADLMEPMLPEIALAVLTEFSRNLKIPNSKRIFLKDLPELAD